MIDKESLEFKKNVDDVLRWSCISGVIIKIQDSNYEVILKPYRYRPKKQNEKEK